jgi:Uma2 family endonuclease
MHIAEKKKYTDEDYMMLEEGAPFQLINYDLVISPSPTTNHQGIALELVLLFASYLKEVNDQGYFAFAPLDVRFDEGNVVQPDIIYISPERKNDLVKDRIEGAPDLLIEILSPSNAIYDLRQKKDLYQKYGVKEYIIIDPVSKNADLYSLKDGEYYLHQRAEKAEMIESVLLPGLSFPLSKIFK